MSDEAAQGYGLVVRFEVLAGHEDAFDALTARPRSSKGGRPPQYSDLEVAQYAARYVELVEDRDPSPVRTLAAEEKLPTSTMRALLSAGRERKLLISEGRGKAGGTLTPKAKRLLRQGSKG